MFSGVAKQGYLLKGILLILCKAMVPTKPFLFDFRKSKILTSSFKGLIPTHSFKNIILMYLEDGYLPSFASENHPRYTKTRFRGGFRCVGRSRCLVYCSTPTDRGDIEYI